MPVSLTPVPTDVPRYRDGFQLASTGVSVGYTDDWQRQHVLEDDGLCALLYQYLHKNIKGREDAMASLRLPDTVVFDHNFPRAWYAYDGENDEITKRPGKMLDAQTMYSYFSLPTPGCDVVAQFVHSTVRDEADATTTSAHHQQQLQQQQQHGSTREAATATTTTAAAGESWPHRRLTYVEYFTADMLRTFLFQQRRKPDGVLQKFVLPRGSGSRRRNAQLHVLWSPVVTLVHSRVNRCCLDDTSASLATRCATYDGPSHLSEETLVADSTARRLDAVCRDMAEHVYRTEKKRLTRMSVYGKISDDNKVWLLWCAGLRVAADALNPSYVRVPLAYDMRIELLNEGLCSAAQLAQRRERQRQLLLLDDALFTVSHDLSFALGVNASHKRQAYALGMAASSAGATPPAPHASATSGTATALPSSSSSPLLQHPLNESFALLYGSADVAAREVCGTRVSPPPPRKPAYASRAAHARRAHAASHAPPSRAASGMTRATAAAAGSGSGVWYAAASAEASSANDDDDDDEASDDAYGDDDGHGSGVTRSRAQPALLSSAPPPLCTSCDATQRPCEAADGDGEHRRHDDHGDDDDVHVVDAQSRQRVREELTSLALDACYAVYSCMLTHVSRTRDTSHVAAGSVELAMPLVTALTPPELRDLTRLLGLQPLHDSSDGGGDTQRYRVVRGAAYDNDDHDVSSGSNAREHDGDDTRARALPIPPLACAERDVDAFFARLFAQRGEAVARHVIEHYSEQLCL